MNDIQELFVILYGLFSLWAAVEGYRHAIRHGNILGETPYFWWMGIFVWGDAVLLGLFGILGSTILLYLHDWWLAMTVLSIFWVVRSHGETIYWLNQQFSTIERNKPSDLWGYQYFPNDSLWFVYQVVWQCVTVVSSVSSLYSAHRFFTG